MSSSVRLKRRGRGMPRGGGRSAPRPGVAGWLAFGWMMGFGLGLGVGDGSVASAQAFPGLRLAPPQPTPGGPWNLHVMHEDASPIPAERLARIEVLAANTVGQSPPPWQAVAGSRVATNGRLHVQYQPSGSGATGAVFFVARETAETIVEVRDAAGLRAAVAAAKPGTRIRLAPGVYGGGFAFANLRGAAGQPVVIAAADPANPPVFQGGANGIQLSDPAFVELHDLVFRGATGNGLNIDDAGTFDTPAHHLVLRGLRITDVGPQGNRDGLKLSGVDDFRVEGCTIERWGAGGSAVDMVGCHRGVLVSNVFRHTEAVAAADGSGVQTKGGTQDIVIRRNRFEYAGSRAVNVGGSTGLEFFRPPLVAGADHWEAKNIRVEGNTFVGSTSPVAFVGVDGAEVRFNTFYRPQRWLLRILQETTAAGFVACRGGVFTDNLVAFHSSQWSAGGVNVGGNTAPQTFRFARNAWYCVDAPARSRPSLPVTEESGTYGVDPRFVDAAGGDFRLASGSPVAGKGAEALPP